MPQTSAKSIIKTKIMIRELSDIKEISSIYPLIKQLNPKLTKARFSELLRNMLSQGYRCIGAYNGEKLVGASGFWTGARFWCGDYVDLDNVVVDNSIRSKGIGKQMIAWVEREAKRLGCTQVGLDSYSVATHAHRFYFREGYGILGYHFVKKI
jgi:GNAT superfamily N-acetyltransferase